jgi:sulfur-oxidizing protein SoxY
MNRSASLVLRALAAALTLLCASVGFQAPAAAGPAHAAPPGLPVDPLNSPIWAYLVSDVLGTTNVRFDERVKVITPDVAENQRQFPVTIDARAIRNAVKIVLFVDLNPIQTALTYDLLDAEPFIATRIKIDQKTPVRAAVLTSDGEWLLGGRWVDAAGGGCSAPPASRTNGAWAKTIGQIRGKAFADPAGSRLRVAFKHPMDTGFVNNIATFYIEQLHIKDASGKVYGKLELQASISEDPVFTLIPHAKDRTEALDVSGRDSDGNRYHAIMESGQ